MEEKDINSVLDGGELDAAIEKTTQLVALLREAKQIIGSFSERELTQANAFVELTIQDGKAKDTSKALVTVPQAKALQHIFSVLTDVMTG